MVVCGPLLYLGSSESRKTVEQKFVFKIGILNPYGIIERLSFNYFTFVFSSPTSTNSVAPLSVGKPTHNP